jgi:hypothetical protein
MFRTRPDRSGSEWATVLWSEQEQPAADALEHTALQGKPVFTKGQCCGRFRKTPPQILFGGASIPIGRCFLPDQRIILNFDCGVHR